MALLAVTSMITVFQRIEQVRRQAKGPRARPARPRKHRMVSRPERRSSTAAGPGAAGPGGLPARLASRRPAAANRSSASLAALAARVVVARDGVHVAHLRRNLTRRRPADPPTPRCSGPGVASYVRTFWEVLALPRWTPRGRPRPGRPGERAVVRERVRDDGRGRRAAAQRQLGPGRRVGLPDRHAGDERGRAARLGRVRRVPRLPRGSRHGDPVAPRPGPGRHARRARRPRPAGVPDGRPELQRARRRGRLRRPPRHDAGRVPPWSPGAAAPR